jgi:hypothetical protein
MSFKSKREVYIEFVRDTWVVLYVKRKKGQHYKAASFYAPDNSRAFVENWVRDNPKLVLVSV